MAPKEESFDFKVLLPISTFLILNKFVDSKNTTTVFLGRLVFIVVITYVFSIWYFTYTKIQQEDNQEKVKLESSDISSLKRNGAIAKAGLRLLKPYISPAISSYVKKLINTAEELASKEYVTAAEYDSLQVFQKVSKLGISRSVISVGHMLLGIYKPLIVSSVIALTWLFDEPVVRIYVLGETEASDPWLKRPFRVKSLMAGIPNSFIDKTVKSKNE
mmetsp:Transcript_19749/g.23952  ORF Transcript_19749/g.23952 Transcript_19749/m.23952 type:complete len:217 (+) Transcript_19749:220-870(+)